MSYLPLSASPGASARIWCIGDPQNSTSYDHPPFQAQIDHAIVNRPDLVVCVGDNTDANEPDAWSFCSQQLERLTLAGIKWVIASGNHDYEYVGTVGEIWNRNTNLNTYVATPPWISGTYQPGHLENSWCVLPLAGIDHLIICLEWSPRNEVVNWASALVTANPSKPVILITHAFLGLNGERYDWGVYGETQDGNPHSPNYLTSPAEGINDGQDMWTKFVEASPNIKVVLSGHTYYPPHRNGVLGGARWKNDVRSGGARCVQVLCDYQNIGPAGNGWLAEYDLDWANRILTARTYSPYLRQSRYNNSVLFREPIN